MKVLANLLCISFGWCLYGAVSETVVRYSGACKLLGGVSLPVQRRREEVPGGFPAG